MVVGLTGGIGSGKTTVAKLFSVLGCPVYNSDDRAKKMYFLPEVKKKVTELLGEKAYTPQGELERAYVSEKIFSDKTLLDKINNIIHPAVGEDFKNFLKQNAESRMVIKESALLFETGIYKQLDKNLLVTSPVAIRIKHLQQRDKASVEQITARINSQMPDEEKIPHSDMVIINDEEHALIPQVLAIYNKLLNA